MSKYSSIGDKRLRDYWPTIDPDAVKPLAPFVKHKTYAEPCYGGGHLHKLLRGQDTSIICRWMSDIEPQIPHMVSVDALSLTKQQLVHCDLIITNPPYTWTTLKPLMDHFISLKPTWLLLPADYMHNKRFAPYLKCCSNILSVGRLYWQPNRVKGKENYAWYRFNRDFEECETIFHGR